MAKLIAAAALAALIFTAGCGMGDNGNDEPMEPQEEQPARDDAAPRPDLEREPEMEPAYSKDDLEYRLAVIDGGIPSVHDPVLNRYRRALSKAERVCPDEDREAIADQAVRSTQLLEDEGVETTALAMLNAVGEAREAGVECAEVFSSIIHGSN